MSHDDQSARSSLRTRKRVYAWIGALAALCAMALALLVPKTPHPEATASGPSATPGDSTPATGTTSAAAGPSATEQPNAHLYAFAHTKTLHAEDFAAVRSPKHPQWAVAPGLDLEPVATGFTYPVNIAFAEPAPTSDDAPWFYVNELHGAIKLVTRAGTVHTFADQLLNFEPVPQPKTDETGISGLMVVAGTEDLIITRSYEDKVSGLLKNQVLRLIGKDGGRSLARAEVLLNLDEYTSPSNQIQQVLLGPDRKLYVSVGDAENARLSLDLDKFGGKILRLNLDGSAPKDNPFYDAKAPGSARSYVFAYGLRNVFDFDFDPVHGGLFAGDNGKDIDRFARIERGTSYHWNGVRESVRLNALYTWNPAVAPCGITFVRGNALGPDWVGGLLLAGYGPPGELGPNHGKVLLRLQLDHKRERLAALPQTVLRYQGSGRASVLGLAESSDGIYFTDFFGETTADSSEGLGTVWRIRPSSETKQLGQVATARSAVGVGLEQGRAHFFNFCASCHTLDGLGGKEGPDLTHFGEQAADQLNSKAYAATLATLIASEQQFLVEQRSRLLAVQQAAGRERVRVWLGHHLEEPRFDNARAKMPSMSFVAPDVRAAIIDFVMSRVVESNTP